MQKYRRVHAPVPQGKGSQLSQVFGQGSSSQYPAGRSGGDEGNDLANKKIIFTDILAGFTVNNRVLRLPAIVLLNTTFRPGNSGRVSGSKRRVQ